MNHSFIYILLRSCVIICGLSGIAFFESTRAQTRLVRHGDDFLNIGAGARYLSMGNTGVSFASDVMAAYWNPAGLAGLSHIQGSYMHAERFAGQVSFDFGSVAIPIDEEASVVAITIFRQAADDIKNTTNAWDRDRGLPYPDAVERFSTFSASDMAFLVSFAGESNVKWGVSAKFLYSNLGPFANGWGYSLDAGLQSVEGPLRWGVMLANATTLSKFWTVNANAFEDRQRNFDEIIPQGQNERVLPTLRAGLSYQAKFGKFSVAAAAETDMRFENRQAFYLNAGPISFEPNFGLELGAFNMLYFRGGLTGFYKQNDTRLMPSPTVGAGLEFKHLSFDYSFDNFQGVSSVLGNTHRISLIVRFGSQKEK